MRMTENYRRIIQIALLLFMAVWLGYEDVRDERLALAMGSVVFFVSALNEIKRAIAHHKDDPSSHTARTDSGGRGVV
jgi:hypothetical protein